MYIKIYVHIHVYIYMYVYMYKYTRIHVNRPNDAYMQECMTVEPGGRRRCHNSM